MNFDDIGLGVPKILLPNTNIDLNKWAVVACDQYTSEPEYWQEIKGDIETSASTLNVIFPEVYLEDNDGDKRILDINTKMDAYLNDGTLIEQKEGFILLDRKTSHAPSRKGLMVALDLERYDYSVGSQTLIRATEGTIVDRLPPRVKIREQASIELPHIMVLIDDPDETVIEPLFNEKLETVYDFELMKNSGHLKGFSVDNPELIEKTANSLRQLAKQEVFDSKYGVSDKGVLLFAMGDGNHSLATAKNIWESKKAQAANKEDVMGDPARYALVELVNVHDQGLEFEPIHRVVFNIDSEDMLKSMQSYFQNQGSNCILERYDSLEECKAQISKKSSDNMQLFTFTDAQGPGIVTLANPKLNLEVGNLQAFIDEYLSKHSDSSVDYIHGEDVVTRLGSEKNSMGFYLPVMGKGELFKTVVLDGALPRKTFSMGEADEKRFYLEARRIK
ncbi:MAG: DUF1015 domain-containing protein [Planctomycetes bacterium]|nr:DUF1015 domain-containing protein [Planctomycetota bacterium]